MNFLCWHEENFRNDFHLVDCKAHFHHRTQKTIKLNKNKARSSSHENIHECAGDKWLQFWGDDETKRFSSFSCEKSDSTRVNPHTQPKRTQHKKSHAQTQKPLPLLPHTASLLANDTAVRLAPIFHTCAARRFGVHQMCIPGLAMITATSTQKR